MEIGSASARRLYDAALGVSQPKSEAAGQAAGAAFGREMAPTSIPFEEPAKPDFMDTAVAAANEAVATVQGGETAAQEMIAGRADPHSVVEALAATEMALEMAVAVRDKVVQAYQEILRMPI